MTAARIPTTIVASPRRESDRDIAVFLERFLKEERPGTSWRVVNTPRGDVHYENQRGERVA